tara:strand:+ start:973 stop:2055 length:1083 start_codon:yes stop_codon:yes gene_type:complete
MVEWLAGNRIKGTSTERTTGAGFNPGDAVTGGWKELGRTTLGSTGDTMDVSSLADKRYYMVLGNAINTGGVIDINQRFGSTTIDTGNNYARRQSINGGSDGTSASRSNVDSSIDGAVNHFMVSYIANKSDKEKLVQSSYTEGNATGSGSAPERSETVGKWANTSNPIDIMRLYNTQAGDYATGSEAVVLGWDPADTHTTNFWEELADVTLSSASDTLSSGTITAKKYLWVQTYVKAVSGTAEPDMRFNGDSGSNYADRYSINGGSDATGTSISQGVRGTGVAVSAFFNDFIINNASNEKLVIRHITYVSTAGAGTAPNRRETVGKWANTSNQITSIDWVENSGGAGQMDIGSFVKVWGSN